MSQSPARKTNQDSKVLKENQNHKKSSKEKTDREDVLEGLSETFSFGDKQKTSERSVLVKKASKADQQQPESPKKACLSKSDEKKQEIVVTVDFEENESLDSQISGCDRPLHFSHDLDQMEQSKTKSISNFRIWNDFGEIELIDSLDFSKTSLRDIAASVSI